MDEFTPAILTCFDVRSYSALQQRGMHFISGLIRARRRETYLPAVCCHEFGHEYAHLGIRRRRYFTLCPADLPFVSVQDKLRRIDGLTPPKFGVCRLAFG